MVRDLIKFCLHFQLYALQLHQKGTFKLLTIYSCSYLKPVIDLIPLLTVNTFGSTAFHRVKHPPVLSQVKIFILPDYI